MARVAVIGNSGTGKSWGSGCLIERVLDPDHPDAPAETFDLAVHFDYEDEEVGLSESGGEFEPLMLRLDVDVARARKINWRKLLLRRRRLRIIPDMTVPAARELLFALSEALMSICKDLHPELTAFLSIDEAHNFIPQEVTDRRIHYLMSNGRKHGIEYLIVSQRPVSLHTSALGLTDRRLYFRVDEKNDLRGLREVATFDVNRLQQLDDREVIVENKSTGESVVESTESWTRLREHHSGDDGVIDDALPI
jgi:DNA helicase HerA-like ATPase